MAQIGRLKVETNVKKTYIIIPSGMLEKAKEVLLKVLSKFPHLGYHLSLTQHFHECFQFMYG